MSEFQNAEKVGHHYTFSHRGVDDRYYWYSVLPIGPNESRHEQISCSVAWFWASHNDGGGTRR